MDAEKAKGIMADVSERNSKYQLLTARDDTMMQRVVVFYNAYGTANERMEAYYLLGSVYRDLHDAPKAVEAYMDGINAADTMAKDCRYDILARLYGQQSDILRKQNLRREYIESTLASARYAERAKDTLLAISNYWHLMGAHFCYGNYEKIAQECWGLLKKSEELGFLQYAATHLNTSILAYIELGRIKDAQRLMGIYEKESGSVDLQTMECSFPIYYYAKGRLLLAQHKTDSAEMFFRRELQIANWNNRQAAYRGLRELFEQRHQTDSALKYARLQCEAVDSDYQTKVTENMQNLQQLYDYNRTQEDNHQKALLLQQEQRRGLYVCCAFMFVLLLLAFLFFYLHSRYKQKVTEAELELERAQTSLAEKESELERLRNAMLHVSDGPDKKELGRQVGKAEREVEAQREEVMRRGDLLDDLRRKALHNVKTLRQQYYDTPAVQHLRVRMQTGKVAQEGDYEEIRQTLEARNRGLMQRLDAMTPHLSDLELRLILLLKVGMRKAEIAKLTAHAESSISTALSRLYEKKNNRKPRNSAESMDWAIRI
ncbi:MAG: hypothetical protein IJ197_09765 [Bacteroidaceae bacterium]|nr:hypothetical protein [Bacteroidaceae bacterium]